MRARWLSLLLLPACASSVGPVARNYERPEGKSIKLESLDVVIVAAKVTTSGPVFNVPAFDPPARDLPLVGTPEDPGTRDALVLAIGQRLRSAGYRPTFVLAEAEPQMIAPLPPVDTSTKALKTSSVAVAAPKLAPPRRPSLEAGATLADVLKSSHADGVLVVRVVPVDAFYVMSAGGPTRAPGQAAETAAVQAQKPLLRSGRLLLGQAFLYDRATGLRLWSRQLPEFPASGLLAVDDPFLAYGVVTDPALTAELPLEVRATKASAAFTQRMFEPLAPARSSEDHEARARLTATDLEADIQKEALLDERQLGLEVALGYGGETAGATVTSKEETIAELHTGAIAPSGVLRIGPQLTYRGTTRFVFTAMANVGLAPGSFGRTYYRDGATQNPGAPSNQIVPVQIAGVTLVGAEVRGGYAFLLSPAWTLAPTAGAFFDAWSLDSDTLADTTHLRFGLVGGIDALWLPSPDGLFYVRGGPVLRLGADSVGPLVFGLGLSLGLGIRL